MTRKFLMIASIIAGCLLFLWTSATGWNAYLKSTTPTDDWKQFAGRWLGVCAVVLLLFIGGLTGPLAWLAMGVAAVWLVVELVAYTWKSDRSKADLIEQGTQPFFSGTNTPAAEATIPRANDNLSLYADPGR